MINVGRRAAVEVEGRGGGARAGPDAIVRSGRGATGAGGHVDRFGRFDQCRAAGLIFDQCRAAGGG